MTTLPSIDGWNKANEDDISNILNCYCPNCGGSNATTVMLPTKIPMFREIYLMSLTCPDCSFKNTEINFGGEIQTKGERITLNVTIKDDLDRQLIKSDSASILIPKLQFEIPPTTQRGSVSTIEGVLSRAAENLLGSQSERLRLGDIDNFYRCQAVIKELRRMSGHPEPNSEDEDEGYKKTETFESFKLILDDPAGNSFIENPHAPATDSEMISKKYNRTPSQDMSLGLQPSKAAVEDGTINDSESTHKNALNDAATPGNHAVAVDKQNNTNLGKQESLTFSTQCPSCYTDAETTMCVTDIPHFKEVIIMNLLCEKCGYRSNEIKGGSAIPKFGTRIFLKVKSTDDLAREVLKSDTAGIEIPEIELELGEGGLDGLYTTVEGLIEKMYARLKGANPFSSGDAAKKQHRTNDGGKFSSPSLTAIRYQNFLQKLQGLKNDQNMPFTLVINDPLSNSFIGPVLADAIALSFQAEKEDNNDCYKQYVDEGMEIEEYERTHQQNESLGLNDMKTENYQVTHGKNDESLEKKYYGTDQPEDLPDRLRRLDTRGPDHPHTVAKGTVDGDITVMGPGSATFATPALAQRGKAIDSELGMIRITTAPKSITQAIRNVERNDENFMMCENFDGSKKGMVFKLGGQGVGYYTDVPLPEDCQNRDDNIPSA